MSDPDQDPVDGRVRRGLEPDAAMVQRVQLGALSERHRTRAAIWLQATASAAAVAVLAVLLWPRSDSTPLDPAALSEERPASGRSCPCLEIHSVGDVVILRSPTGQVLAMTSGGLS
jgi:hypothetical protein